MFAIYQLKMPLCRRRIFNKVPFDIHKQQYTFPHEAHINSIPSSNTSLQINQSAKTEPVITHGCSYFQFYFFCRCQAIGHCRKLCAQFSVLRVWCRNIGLQTNHSQSSQYGGQTGNNFHYLSESTRIKEKTINPTNYYD